VAKNVIRGSHHGCIVIASTHDVAIEDNVAFDNAGHCFVLRDGTEAGIAIRRNLAIKTKLSEFSESTEETGSLLSSSAPASFYITNLLNTVEGNVGSGSQGEGFAIRLTSQSRAHESKQGNFRSNVASSNKMVSEQILTVAVIGKILTAQCREDSMWI